MPQLSRLEPHSSDLDALTALAVCCLDWKVTDCFFQNCHIKPPKSTGSRQTGPPFMLLLGRQSDVPDCLYFCWSCQFHPNNPCKASNSGNGQAKHKFTFTFLIQLHLPSPCRAWWHLPALHTLHWCAPLSAALRSRWLKWDSWMTSTPTSWYQVPTVEYLSEWLFHFAPCLHNPMAYLCIS